MVKERLAEIALYQVPATEPQCAHGEFFGLAISAQPHGNIRRARNDPGVDDAVMRRRILERLRLDQLVHRRQLGGCRANQHDSTRIDTITPNATVIGAAGAQATGLRVGVSATGALTIQSGGTMNNTLGIIADNVGSTGTATVDGAGSSWTNSGDFYVGHDGNGTLTISNGGAVSNASALSALFHLDRHRDGRRRRLDLDQQPISRRRFRQRHADHPQWRRGEQ